jgi:hypothetical protein
MPNLAHYLVSPHDHDLHPGCRNFSHDVAVSSNTLERRCAKRLRLSGEQRAAFQE